MVEIFVKGILGNMLSATNRFVCLALFLFITKAGFVVTFEQKTEFIGMACVFMYTLSLS